MKKILIIFFSLLFFRLQVHSQNLKKQKSIEKTIQYEGKSFFPIGFYYYPDNVADFDNKELDLLVASGFNTIHIDIKDTANCFNFFDQCHKKGLKIVAQFVCGFGHFSMGDVSFLPIYKDHPALLGWSIADDANNGKYTIDSIEIRDKIVKAKKATLPTFLSVYKNHEQSISKTPEELLRTGDVFGYEMYPVDNWGQAMGAFAKEDELVQVEKELSIFQKANLNHFNKILVAIPQTFSWGFYTENKKANLPTPKELRNITYTGIMNGAKGVLNYCFGQKEIPEKNIAYFKLPMADTLWRESMAIAKELHQLKEVLLHGARIKIAETNEKWIAMTYWKHQAKTYLMVNNLHKTNFKNLNFEMPWKGKLRNVFGNRNSSLTLIHGKLTGEIPPMEVQIFEVNN